MSLWGNKDSKTASGTIEIAANGTITGSSTAFTTEARVGDYIRVSGEDYLVKSISSNTAAVVVAGVPGATLTARSAGSSYTLSEKPKSVTTSEAKNTSGTQGDPTKVYGVDTNETTAKQGSIPHAGWVRRVAGSGNRSGRTSYEVLVAMSSISGDQADDTQFQDLTILIGTQPSSASVTAPAATSFTVAATTTPTGGSLSYQWQVDTGGGFGNVSNGATGGGGNYTGATTATLAIDDSTGLDGYIYRVQISATGADTVTSSSATLTVA